MRKMNILGNQFMSKAYLLFCLNCLPHFINDNGHIIKTTANKPNNKPAQLVPMLVNMKVANNGKTPPKIDLKKALAAIALAAKTK